MKIETAIKNANFDELHNIASKANPVLSFWGVRSIQVIGFKDIGSIDFLAGRLMELVKAKGFEYTPSERDIGKQTVLNINKIYEASDEQVIKSNIITRIICFVQNRFYKLSVHIFCMIKPTKTPIRWIWDDNVFRNGFNNVFDHYTRRQYREKFNRDTSFYYNKWSGDIELAWGADLR